MVKGRLVFTHVIQDSQDFGGDDQHMASRVFFSLEMGEKVLKGLHSDIKQTVGTDFETAPLEVDYPQPIRGLVPFDAFRQHAERYYRDSFGSSGRAIRFGPGSQVRMRHNIVQMVKVIDIEADDKSEPSGW